MQNINAALTFSNDPIPTCETCNKPHYLESDLTAPDGIVDLACNENDGACWCIPDPDQVLEGITIRRFYLN
jgi:hypothetical protein